MEDLSPAEENKLSEQSSVKSARVSELRGVIQIHADYACCWLWRSGDDDDNVNALEWWW